jgi:hypothetical protein
MRITLPHFEVDRGLFPPIARNLVLDGLSLVKRTQPGPLNCRNVDEHISATTAACRLNESITLCRIEPLYSACSHFRLQY